MEKIRAFVQEHKMVSYAVGLGFIIFINCFGFPLYNLNKEWSHTIMALNIYTVVTAAFATGGILYGLYSDKKLRYVLMISIMFSLGGLLCRYFLEYGEVSNTYNFTLPNVILHLVVFIGISILSWLHFTKKNNAN